MIEVKERVVVDGTPERVWSIVSDPAAVASCIAGCELGEQRDDGSYDATIGVKFGGIRVRFRTTVHLEVHEPTMTGQLRIAGADQQGATRVGGTAHFEVHQAAADQSAVEFNGSLDINGKLATLIASGANVVVSRMTREFTECLSSKLAVSSTEKSPVTSSTVTAIPATTATPASAAAPGVSTTSLQASSLGGRLRMMWTSLMSRLRGAKGQH